MESTRNPEAFDVIRQLVRRIEDADYSLHRDGNYVRRCERIRKGLDQSTPADCTCGLDALLAEARAITGDEALERSYQPKKQTGRPANRLRTSPATNIHTWDSLQTRAADPLREAPTS